MWILNFLIPFCLRKKESRLVVKEKSADCSSWCHHFPIVCTQFVNVWFMSQCSQTAHRSIVWDCTNAVHFHSRLLSYRLVPAQSWNTCRRHSSSVSSSGFPLRPRSAAGRCQSTECGTWLLKTPSLCYQHHRAGKHHVFFKPWKNIRHLAEQYIVQVQPPRTFMLLVRSHSAHGTLTVRDLCRQSSRNASWHRNAGELALNMHSILTNKGMTVNSITLGQIYFRRILAFIWGPRYMIMAVGTNMHWNAEKECCHLTAGWPRAFTCVNRA
jgi:hypothetical protein